MIFNLIEKMENANALSLEKVFSKRCNVYTFLNPVSYLSAIKNRNLFSQMDAVFVDGSILVMAIRLLYGKKIKRKSFDMTSMAPMLFKYVVQNKKSIYIVASKEEQVKKAIEVLRNKYSEVNIIGYRNGYFFSEEEKLEEIWKIKSLNPDFLIVGMGIISQEDFLLKAKIIGYKGIGFTCGGFIHQIARNEIDYYPRWIDKFNLRFIYRIYKEKHTRKRYLQAAISFPFHFLWNKFFG